MRTVCAVRKKNPMDPTGAHHPPPPTSSLPPLRSLEGGGLTAEEDIFAALRNLHALYCPLPTALSFRSSREKAAARRTRGVASGDDDTDDDNDEIASPPVGDSGYVSGDEDHDGEDAEDVLAALRADMFERDFAARWLTGLVGRAEGLVGVWADEDACERAVEQAACVLASFSSAVDVIPEDDEEPGITRVFSFVLGGGRDSTITMTTACEDDDNNDNNDNNDRIEVRLLDRPIGTGTDHTDVGLQSWGASIVFSDLLCANPGRFFGPAGVLLGRATPPLQPPRIVELGAGTGLVGLTIAKLLPRVGVAGAAVVATDYHPAVLENLRSNVAANFPEVKDDDGRGGGSRPPVETCLLDWSAPSAALSSPPLDEPADLVVATDVIYAPEHALWLRDCVARLLAPRGAFWLMATVRQDGKFEGISDTVEAAFRNAGNDDDDDYDGRSLRILQTEMVEKRSGIGRGDESGYTLYRIGWSD